MKTFFLYLRYVEFNSEGFLFFEFFENKFCVPFWRNLLQGETHLDWLERVKNECGLDFFLHDQCMKGSKPVSTLDQVFGPVFGVRHLLLLVNLQLANDLSL